MHIHLLFLVIQDQLMIDQLYEKYFLEDVPIHTLNHVFNIIFLSFIILSFSARSLLYFEKAIHSSGVICPLIGRHGSGL